MRKFKFLKKESKQTNKGERGKHIQSLFPHQGDFEQDQFHFVQQRTRMKQSTTRKEC